MPFVEPQALDPLVPIAPVEAAPAGPRHLPWWIALLQVLLVCGIPTQLAIFVPIAMFSGVPILEGKQISIEMFALTSLIDTALICILIRVFLGISGEDPQDVFVGRRPALREGLLGILILPGVYAAVALIAFALRTYMPWTHTVAQNPYEEYMRSPLEAAIFAVVVVLAGGVREELQRAFILHRFEQRLGGAWVGLVVFSLFFGALHVTEGIDAAMAVGLLGLFWGIVYIRRRSAILPLVNHAGFDLVQVLQVVLARGFTG